MGALTDQLRTSTKSPPLSSYSFSINGSKSRSRLFSERLETEERRYTQSTTPLSTPNQISWYQKKKQRLGSPTPARSHHSLLLPRSEPSTSAANLASCQRQVYSDRLIRTLESFPPPSPLTRAVQGPQRPQQHFRMFSTPKQLRESVSEAQHLEDERNSKTWCFEESSNPKALEDFKRRVALLQKQFGYVQRNDNGGDGPFTQQGALQLSPSSSSTITAHVDAERGTEAMLEHGREAQPSDDREAKVGNSQPRYKELFEETKKRDFKLKRLELELELATTKLNALQFTKKKLFKAKEKEEAAVEHKSKHGYECLNVMLKFPNETLLVKWIEQALEDAFAPLNDDEEADVAHALKGGNSREVLVMHENSNIEITKGLLQCLLPGGWLNDEVINLYLELLKEREKREPDKFLKCHFFNTFFYKKLYNPNTRYDYKAVRRWTTQRKIGYSLMDCDKIFIPIHKEIHWCLAIIDMKAKKFQYLDSLRGSDAHVLDVLVKYITDEAKDKTGKDLDVSSWETQLVEDLPQQENGSDCGMFMIKYADFHSRGLPLSFFQTHMPYFRKRTAKEILRLKAE